MRLLTDEETVCRDKHVTPRLMIDYGLITTCTAPIAHSWVYFHDCDKVSLIKQQLDNRLVDAVNFNLRVEIYRALHNACLYRAKRELSYETY